MLKQKLKVLNRRYFSNIVEEADADRMALAKAQAELHRNPLDASCKHKNCKSSKSSKDLPTWQKRLQEAIIQLADKCGKMKSDQEEIAEIFLVRPYTAAEVKAAMFSISERKSPGPDSYRSDFYKASWSIVGEEVTNAVPEFLDNGQLLTQINSTSIALIPKVENPLQASQFRPISCCSVLYKCISKIVCKRLRKAIPLIVADIQAAVIQGRSLIHNVLICHDLLRHYNRKTTPRCLMKIDLKKAYDMVRWEFLKEVLKGYGFPMPFIQLIMVCVYNNYIHSKSEWWIFWIF
ncbi:PREDICTED: uncharacterized protein LOC109241315 [Nicotiana attenuata]|uniref:uncharacterized protein LOC109241315 n=1 Tax=Nicotiana attenuata TaxID=49451 RepID=UPI0009053CCB|nr:PREDICTED: uncharacterized protein LOC109241315 [Nicotiana attenuata]